VWAGTDIAAAMFCVILEGSMGGSLFSFQLLLYILPIFNVFRYVLCESFCVSSLLPCVCGGGGWFLSDAGGSGKAGDGGGGGSEWGWWRWGGKSVGS